MKVNTIYTKYSNNYLVEKDGKVLLVDCSCNLEDLQKFTSKLDAIIITHGHFDHFAFVEQIQQAYNCPVFMHKNTLGKMYDAGLNGSVYFGGEIACHLAMSCVNFVIQGKQNIEGVEVEIYFVPGHTDDSIAIAIEDFLFVGDFIFEHGYGRTDLPTGSFVDLKQSLRKMLPIIRNYTLFYGHD